MGAIQQALLAEGTSSSGGSLTITSSSTYSMTENTTASVATMTATGTGTLTWSITGGTDQAQFVINPTTGALLFAKVPDYEAPTDSNTDNVYQVTVQVSDGTSTASQSVSVTITNSTDFGTGPWDGLAATPVVAYSVRRLLTSYTGSSINIRRSSDSATYDVGFVGSGGDLDTAAIAAFCGSGVTGTITKWYNQGSFGSSADAAQTTTTAQATIFDGTSVVTLGTNAKPAMSLNGAQGYMANNIAAAPYNCVAVITHPSNPSNFPTIFRQNSVGTVGGLGTYEWAFRIQSNGGLNFYVLGTITCGESSGFSTAGAVETFHSTSSAAIYKNGTQVATAAGRNPDIPSGLRDMGFGQNPGSAERFNGKIAEAAIFQAVLSSTDRSTVQTNQKSYWGTP